MSDSFQTYEEIVRWGEDRLALVERLAIVQAVEDYRSLAIDRFDLADRVCDASSDYHVCAAAVSLMTELSREKRGLVNDWGMAWDRFYAVLVAAHPVSIFEETPRGAAWLAREERANKIDRARNRIASGFYDSPEVLDVTVDRLAADLGM